MQHENNSLNAFKTGYGKEIDYFKNWCPDTSFFLYFAMKITSWLMKFFTNSSNKLTICFSIEKTKIILEILFLIITLSSDHQFMDG